MTSDAPVSAAVDGRRRVGHGDEAALHLPADGWNLDSGSPVVWLLPRPWGGRHSQANRRTANADLLGRVRRRHHVRRNPAPLDAECRVRSQVALMKIADPNRKTPPSTRRKSHLRAINARLRAHWQDLNAIAPQRDYDNLLAQAFSGHERYRPDTVNDDHVDEAYSKKS
jgi:hypothetical protein